MIFKIQVSSDPKKKFREPFAYQFGLMKPRLVTVNLNPEKVGTKLMNKSFIIKYLFSFNYVEKKNCKQTRELLRAWFNL